MPTLVFTGAEAAANVTPAGVKADAKKGILHRLKGVLVREPTSSVTEQGAGTYDKEKVLVARESELGGGRKAGSKEGDPSKFTIQAEAEATLIDTVQDFVLHLDNPVLAANLEPWQKDFIKQFKTNAANTSSAAYDPSRLHQYAEAFVRTNEGVIAALKIAEWKIALYQKATGAQMYEIQSHDVTHNPDIIAMGIDVEIQSPHRNPFQKLILKAGVGRTPLEKAVHDKAEADKKRPMNQKDRNYYSQARFPNPNQLRYSGALLSPGQRAYLRSVGIDVETPAVPAVPPAAAVPAIPINKDFNNAPGSGNRNASAEQVRLGKIMEDLTNARVAVYEATGKFNIDINLVDRTTGNYIGTPEQYLRVEHVATGPDAHAAIENQLRAATTEMTKKNKEVAKKAAKQVKDAKATEEKRKSDESMKFTLHLIEDKKAELSRGAPPVAPDAQKTIDANEATITAETKKADELKAAVEQGKQLPDLKKALDDAQAAIPNFAEVEMLNLPVDRAGLPQHGSVREAEAALISAMRKTKAAESKLNLLKTRQKNAQEAIGKTKGMAESLVKLVGEEFENTKDISAVQTEYDDALAEQVAAEADLNTKKALKDKFANEWQTYQQAQKALAASIRAYTDMAVRHGVPTVVADVLGIPGFHVQEADMQAVIDSAESHVKTLNQENAKLEDPSKMEREHQLAAYEELTEGVTPQDKCDAMKQRIIDIDLKKYEPLIKDMHAAGIYEEYPHVYLRALQVVFGWEITDYSKAAEFQKATKLLTPQMFLDTLDAALLQKPNPSFPPPTIKIVDPFDPALRDPVYMRHLTSKSMKAFTEKLLDDAAKGTLGQISAAEVAEREAMQVRDGSDIFVAPIIPADRNGLLQTLTQDIYHYEDVDDLARIILARHTGAVNGTAQINNADDAKAYAKEIVRMRNVVI